MLCNIDLTFNNKPFSCISTKDYNVLGNALYLGTKTCSMHFNENTILHLNKAPASSEEYPKSTMNLAIVRTLYIRIMSAKTSKVSVSIN